jgi:sugar phosphate isomerase/epimerase
LAIHTITNKPWSLRQCIDGYRAAGISGISVWRNVLEPIGAAEAAKMLGDGGLHVPALVRGGFFPGWEVSYRQWAIDENKRIIDEAATIGAEIVVLVVGAVPGMPLDKARQQVTDGIAAVKHHAAQSNVKLAIEPLHPMYADNRSCVTTMAQARRICEAIGSAHVG